ncbi:MAG: hypothetical protein ACI8XM_000864 [Haloarculaceae archaeon]|jgi:hypothetical protein
MRFRKAIQIAGILLFLTLALLSSTSVAAHEGHGSTPETPLEPSDEPDWPRLLTGGIGAVVILVTVTGRSSGESGRLEQLLGFGLGTILIVYGGLAVV